ncbi:zinc finger protein 62 [Biomphalaria glabrata]|nr:Biomphalaria glabrata zinc finger protein 62-like [Biomphalaria glabrata]
MIIIRHGMNMLQVHHWMAVFFKAVVKNTFSRHDVLCKAWCQHTTAIGRKRRHHTSRSVPLRLRKRGPLQQFLIKSCRLRMCVNVSEKAKPVGEAAITNGANVMT